MATWTQIRSTPIDLADYTQTAGALFNKAITSAQEGIEARRNKYIDENTRSFMQQLQGVNTLEDYDARKGELQNQLAGYGGLVDVEKAQAALNTRDDTIFDNTKTAQERTDYAATQAGRPSYEALQRGVADLKSETDIDAWKNAINMADITAAQEADLTTRLTDRLQSVRNEQTYQLGEGKRKSTDALNTVAGLVRDSSGSELSAMDIRKIPEWNLMTPQDQLSALGLVSNEAERRFQSSDLARQRGEVIGERFVDSAIANNDGLRLYNETGEIPTPQVIASLEDSIRAQARAANVNVTPAILKQGIDKYMGGVKSSAPYLARQEENARAAGWQEVDEKLNVALDKFDSGTVGFSDDKAQANTFVNTALTKIQGDPELSKITPTLATNLLQDILRRASQPDAWTDTFDQDDAKTLLDNALDRIKKRSSKENIKSSLISQILTEEAIKAGIEEKD